MLNTVQHFGVLDARDGEASMLPSCCGMVHKKNRGKASLGTSWLLAHLRRHRQYCGHWRFHLCRMALSLSGCFLACKVFEPCCHGGVACCLLSGVVLELSAPAVFGEASSRQSQCLTWLLSNSCHAFTSISSSSIVEPVLPEGEVGRNWEGSAFGVGDSLSNANAFEISKYTISPLLAW